MDIENISNTMVEISNTKKELTFSIGEINKVKENVTLSIGKA
ncbi:hypothetical protein [Clostridium rectalis]|nr:hypothetical protein [Clostridium rectalis]